MMMSKKEGAKRLFQFNTCIVSSDIQIRSSLYFSITGGQRQNGGTKEGDAETDAGDARPHPRQRHV